MTETKHTPTTYYGYGGSVIDADHLNGIARKLRTVASVWTGDKEAREMADWCERAVRAYDDLRAQLASREDEAQRWHSEAMQAKSQLAAATKLIEHAAKIFRHCTVETGCCCCGVDMKSHGYDDNHSPRDEGAYQVELWWRRHHAFLASNPTPEDAG